MLLAAVDAGSPDVESFKVHERLARHYLAHTEMTPTEISFPLGFDNSNSLFRAFHRWTGTTPESWRSRVRAAG